MGHAIIVEHPKRLYFIMLRLKDKAKHNISKWLSCGCVKDNISKAHIPIFVRNQLSCGYLDGVAHQPSGRWSLALLCTANQASEHHWSTMTSQQSILDRKSTRLNS